jgi:hypothetical protein
MMLAFGIVITMAAWAVWFWLCDRALEALDDLADELRKLP